MICINCNEEMPDDKFKICKSTGAICMPKEFTIKEQELG